MKPIKSTIIAFLLPIIISQLSFGSVLSSSRSRKAISKVKPTLIKALNRKNLQWGAPIFIRIFKQSSELELWVKNEKKFDLFRTYKICTYSGGLGPKQRQGDLQAAEGFYFVAPSQMNPASQFHLSFNIGYPNKYDLAHNRTGGLIMVHGNCVSIGCFAMTDKNIEEIYALADAALRNGQKFFRVHIFPFRMTDKNMKASHRSKWFSFWDNLKEGYDFFEKYRKPPNVLVKNKRYLFEKDKNN